MAMAVASLAPERVPTSPKLHILHSGDLAEEIATLALSHVPGHAAMESMENFRPWSKQVELGVAGPLMVVFIVSTVENDQPPEKAGRCVRFFARSEHPKNFLEVCAIDGGTTNPHDGWRDGTEMQREP